MVEDNKKKEEITLDDIILWIIKNSDDMKAMDSISTTAFPYSTKFKNTYGGKNY